MRWYRSPLSAPFQFTQHFDSPPFPCPPKFAPQDHPCVGHRNAQDGHKLLEVCIVHGMGRRQGHLQGLMAGVGEASGHTASHQGGDQLRGLL